MQKRCLRNGPRQRSNQQVHPPPVTAQVTRDLASETSCGVALLRTWHRRCWLEQLNTKRNGKPMLYRFCKNLVFGVAFLLISLPRASGSSLVCKLNLEAISVDLPRVEDEIRRITPELNLIQRMRFQRTVRKALREDPGFARLRRAIFVVQDAIAALDEIVGIGEAVEPTATGSSILAAFTWVLPALSHSRLDQDRFPWVYRHNIKVVRRLVSELPNILDSLPLHVAAPDLIRLQDGANTRIRKSNLVQAMDRFFSMREYLVDLRSDLKDLEAAYIRIAVEALKAAR